MSERLKLVSAGRDVKVWDCSKYSLCYSYGGELATSFRSVHWNPEFNLIVSTPASGKCALLTSTRGAGLNHFNIDTGYDNTVACFTNCTGRHIGIGTKTGKVCLWDVKYKKSLKTFSCDKSEINCVRCCSNDSFMAAGSANGNIVLMNLETTQVSSTLPCAPGHSINCLQYSYAKKHLVGCTSDEGSVYLWDTNGKRVTASFQSVHVARATGLSFSPTNNLLLTSVGLDRNLICYDTESKKPVRTLECEVPLTCIDFKEDGFTLAVGTMRGTILIFDLRNLVYPFQTVPAHVGPVTSLCYQTNVIAAAEQEKSTKKGSSARSSAKSLKTLSFINEVDGKICSFGGEKVSTNPNIPSAAPPDEVKNRGSLTSEIFSPLKGDQPSISPCVALTSENSALSSGNKSMKQFRKSLPLESSLVSVFSPLEESNKNTKEMSPGNEGVGKLSFSELPSPNSYSLLTARTWHKPEPNLNFSGKLASPSSNISPNKWPTEKPAFNASSNCMPDLSCLTLRGMCSSKNASDQNQSGVQNPIQSPSPDSFRTPKSVTVTPPSLDDIRACDVSQVEVNGFGNNAGGSSRINDFIKDDVGNIVDGFIDEGKGTSIQNTPLTPQEFQTEYIRQLILDAMEEHTDNMRRDFHVYHVQMSRQLEKQKEEIENLFKKYSVDADLMSEVVSLKKENNFLKHVFR